MKTEILMEKSQAFLTSERRRSEPIPYEPPPSIQATITLSHQTGAGAPEIAEEIAQILQNKDVGGAGRWEVFNQQIFEQALQREHWPKKLAETITEEKRFFIDEVMDDLFSLKPPSWVLMPRVVETTLNLAMTGHAILIGHGATAVTKDLPNVFHARLTGSAPQRIERIRKLKGLTPEEAARFVHAADHKREKFLKAFFHVRPKNELLYDLTINTDRLSNADAAAIISEAAQRFFSTM